MKRLTLIPIIVVAALLCLGNTQCQSDDSHTTVSTAPGVAVAALGTAQVEQVNDLKKNVSDLKQQNIELQKVNAKAAGSVHGIQVAAKHIEEPKDAAAREAVLEEAKLAEAALKAHENAPAEVVAAYAKAAFEAEQRVNLVLTGQRDAAVKDYAAAGIAIEAQKELVAVKDKEITAREKTIAERDAKIVQLGVSAQKERDEAAKQIQAVIDAKEKALADFKSAQAAKERRLWISTLRFGGLGFIAIGIIAIAISQGTLWAQGGLMILGGVSTIAAGLFLDILTSQTWFPYALGVVAILILAGGGWWLYELWKGHKLNDKLIGAVQDMKDEADVKGNSALWNEAKEHLKYRLGESGSFWSKTIQQKLAQRGLVNGIPLTNVEVPMPPVVPPSGT